MDSIPAGTILRADPATGMVENVTTGEAFACAPVPEHLMAIMEAGGLMSFVKARWAA